MDILNIRKDFDEAFADAFSDIVADGHSRMDVQLSENEDTQVRGRQSSLFF